MREFNTTVTFQRKRGRVLWVLQVLKPPPQPLAMDYYFSAHVCHTEMVVFNTEFFIHILTQSFFA